MNGNEKVVIHDPMAMMDFFESTQDEPCDLGGFLTGNQNSKDNPEDSVKTYCHMFDHDLKTKEMLDLQEDLNRETFNVHGTSYKKIMENNGFFYAIADELGEWNHERKHIWCWWKKSTKIADRQKELEEFADVMHFVFSYALAMEDGNSTHAITNAIRSRVSMKKKGFLEKQPLHWKISYLLDCLSRTDVDDIRIWSRDVIPVMFAIAEDCGYTFDEVYNAYKRKNAENHWRLQNGY